MSRRRREPGRDNVKECGHFIGYRCCCNAEEPVDEIEDCVSHIDRKWRAVGKHDFDQEP